MRVAAAGLVALLVLHLVDAEFNNARYTRAAIVIAARLVAPWA